MRPARHHCVVRPWRVVAAVTALLLVSVTGCTSERPSRSSDAPGVHVLDGDTIRNNTDGKDERIRILGIDAPEISHEGRPAECGGDDATDALRRILDGAAITIITDSLADDTDKYGRQLRHLQADGKDVGLTMIEQGHAIAYTPKGEPGHDLADQYVNAARQAQHDRIGSWAPCPRLTKQ